MGIYIFVSVCGKRVLDNLYFGRLQQLLQRKLCANTLVKACRKVTRGKEQLGPHIAFYLSRWLV